MDSVQSLILLDMEYIWKKVYEVPVPVVDYGNLCVAEHITLRGVGGRNTVIVVYSRGMRALQTIQVQKQYKSFKHAEIASLWLAQN